MRQVISLLLWSALLISCGPSLEKSATQTAASASAIAASWTPTETAIPTAILIAVPTSIPKETPSKFGGCDVLTRDQIEGVVGPLNSAQINPSVDEGIGYFEGCIYDGSAAFVILNYGPIKGITAHAYYEQTLGQYDASQFETLSELGETAFWLQQDTFSGQLYVLRKNIVLSVLVSGETAREMAIQIAQIALRQIPSPLVK